MDKIIDKLDRITDIWNHFIWEYKFCSSKIKFDEDVKTNYFGDLLGYFKDTLEIVYSEIRPANFSEKFSYTISFLQAIYIQQDFVQEMLELFKTEITKSVLHRDPLYSVNREIRNELVGHPIRKFRDKLISSTLFSYKANEDEIEYLRYHKDNNFKFEGKRFKINDIQARHDQFLNKYFDIMLIKLKGLLDEYSLELDKVEEAIGGHDFNVVLNMAELYFESIFKSDFIYDKSSLLKIYSRKEEHPRYKIFIEKFINDLESHVKETKNNITGMFELKPITEIGSESLIAPEIEIVFYNPGERNLNLQDQKVTYHYELGKLATKRNKVDFEFFSGFLRTKCRDNQRIIDELNRMEANIFNEIEYYTSLRLISRELKEE